tara:strand:+ start:1482 stop:1664 length:183 start_codon:yes stop_codon:yes gene_type:complete
VSDWWQGVRAYWGNPETLEDYEKILREIQHREKVVGGGRKDVMERHAIEDMIAQLRREEE